MERTTGMIRRWSPFAATALAALLAGGTVGGCGAVVDGVQARDTVSLTLDAPRGMPARVETFNGGIEVRPGAGLTITAQVVRTGHGRDQQAAESDRDAIAVTLEAIDGVAVLRAVYAPDPMSIPSGSGAAVTLLVPPDAEVELLTSNGPIMVQGLGGGLDVQTSNGPIELAGVAGTVSAATSNGPITVVTATPVSVDLRTSNGGVTLDGELLPGDAMLETSNGPVELRLPADAAFTIDAQTSAASATSEFDLDGTIDDGSLSGTVGPPDEAAAVSITVRTSNGPVRLLRGDQGS
jgi:hypothetical protein